MLFHMGNEFLSVHFHKPQRMQVTDKDILKILHDACYRFRKRIGRLFCRLAGVDGKKERPSLQVPQARTERYLYFCTGRRSTCFLFK